ncbi:MAG TPA: hypothetical protein ENG51_04305 [Deltaproteobacteria bacterium]|nr:hypothetical protein [Deltaproteobacteria bacterium]
MNRYIRKYIQLLAVEMQMDLLQALEEEILHKCLECRLDIAATLEDARQLMLIWTYDVIVSDIANLSVSRFNLADLLGSRNIPVFLLSNNSISPKDLMWGNEVKVQAFLAKKDIDAIIPMIKQVLQFENLPD